MPASPLVPFSRPEDEARILSPEEKVNIAEGRRMADAARAAEGKAKFKIELLFTEAWSVIKPVPGVISFWESGSQLHGGGDAIIHFCPGKRLGKNDCDHYIPDPSHGYGILVCPRCLSVWKGDDVWGQHLGRHTAKDWALVITNFYRKLDMNCDIVIKYHRTDIRKASQGIMAEDTLYKARSGAKRLKRIYLLSALMRDTSTGSGLYDRILAFVTA
jgi:hypothetical protein